MKTYFKKLGALICSAFLLAAAGCATIEGAGEDIESAGEVVQDAAQSNDN
jgi:predicted small secreted protein